MKFKISVLLVLVLLCASGCTQKGTPNAPQQYSKVEYQQDAGNRASLVRISSPVVRGSYCELTVQGRPGVEYSAAAVYRVGNDDVSTLEKKKADEAGLVSWSWRVSGNTNPGVYTVSVIGDGETITATYTVTQ